MTKQPKPAITKNKVLTLAILALALLITISGFFSSMPLTALFIEAIGAFALLSFLAYSLNLKARTIWQQQDIITLIAKQYALKQGWQMAFLATGDDIKNAQLIYSINSPKNTEKTPLENHLINKGLSKSTIDNLEKTLHQQHLFTSGGLIIEKLLNNSYQLIFIKDDTAEEGVCLPAHFNFGMIVFDENGVINKVNDTFANILGYAKSELLHSQRLEDLLDSPETLPAKFQYSWQGILTFKTRFSEKLSLFYVQKPILNADGDLEEISAVTFKLNTSALNDSINTINIERYIEYSWKCFFNDAPIPVAIIDKEGTILKINDNFSNIIGEKTLVGQTIFAQFDNIDSAQIEQEIEKALLEPEYKSNALMNLKINGSSLVLNLFITRIVDQYDKPIALVIRGIDITHERELEENLSHAQRMQTVGYLAGSIAHDFNNIITAIGGFCELLLMRHHANDPSFENIMQIQQSSNRAANLVNRLLAFSRKQTLSPRVIDLNEAFIDISTVMERLLSDEVTLNKEIAADTWPIKVDAVQLEQVLLNLVVNAHQAMENKKAEAQLNIRVHNIIIEDAEEWLSAYSLPKGSKALPQKGEFVAIEIKDNGSGIPAEIADKIFEPFFTTKREKSGTGLGLATVYGIAIQSGGYVLYNSTPNVGTSFLLLFKRHIPRLNEKQQSPPPVNIYHKKDFSGEGVIVIVEDEDAVRLLAHKALSNKGYEVYDFNHADTALKALEKLNKQVALIISDVVMPGINGPGFIEQATKIRPEAKVIFISGYGEDVFTKAYGKERHFEFLPKPFSLKELVSKVKEVMGEEVN